MVGVFEVAAHHPGGQHPSDELGRRQPVTGLEVRSNRAGDRPRNPPDPVEDKVRIAAVVRSSPRTSAMAWLEVAAKRNPAASTIWAEVAVPDVGQEQRRVTMVGVE